jgi:hypothetical protein
MFRLLTILIVLLIGSSTSRAQAVVAIPMPFDSIQLTPAQHSAIEADWATRRVTMRAIAERIRIAGRVTDADRAELKAFADARNAVVRGVLTAEQNTQLDRNLVRITEARRQGVPLRRGQP